MQTGQGRGFWSRRWKTIVNVVTMVAFGVLVYLLRDEIASVVGNFGKVNTWALLLMIPIQYLNYHSYARIYQAFFGIINERVRYWDMFKLSLELNFVNHVFPSGGVSGISYFGLRMKSYGVGVTKSTLAQVMKFALVFVSFQALLFFGLFSLSLANRANNLMVLVAGSLATAVLLGTLVTVYILESRQRINNFLTGLAKSLNRLIGLMRPARPETINIERAQIAFDELHENYLITKRNWRAMRRPLLYAFLANLTEVLTIYVVFLAFGQQVNIGAVILAYAVANFAGLISVLPGGVGVYETIMTAVMAAAGVPAGVTIPVILMYRVINVILQLPIGYVFYHQALRGRGFEAPRA